MDEGNAPNMTKRLYLDDAYLFEFESSVEDVQKSDEGYQVVLQSSAFYPESGGQPCDTGLLDDKEVIKVFENDAGEVVHLVKEWKADTGTVVRGIINRDRRLDNMRTHTGQHILSRAFIEVVGADTLSSHLGEAESAIELSIGSLNEDAMQKAEELANRIVLENHPVMISYFSRSELNRLPVRKIPERHGRFRIVQIGNFDYAACGGTHCRYTGEVGLTKIIGLEKLRGHIRVSFLTGKQAMDDYRKKHDTISKLSNRLTCHFSDLNRSIDKLLEQHSALRKEVSALNKRLLPYELKRLEENSLDVCGVKIVVEKYDNKEPKDLKELATGICQSFNSVSVLSSGDKVMISVPGDVPVDASMLAGLFMQKFGGKGGGSAAFAQIGGIPLEKRDEFLNGFVEIIKTEIGG